MPALTNYTGNVGLGQGGTDVSVIAPESRSLNIIQDTASRIMMQNHENNVKLFQQKVADRDTLYKMLADGQVVVGDMEEIDKPWYEKGKKEQNDAFFQMADNGGINNKDAYQKYIKSTTELNNKAIHVQARKIAIDSYRQQIAKEPIKTRQDEIRKQLDKQLAKGTGAVIDPYQQSLDFDAEKLLGGLQKGSIIGGVKTPTSTTTTTKQQAGKEPVTTTTTKTGAAKPTKGQPSVISTAGAGRARAEGGAGGVTIIGGVPYSVSNQYVDFNKILQNSSEQFLLPTGEGVALQTLLFDNLNNPQVMDKVSFDRTFTAMIDKSKQYNRERGFEVDANGNPTAAAIKQGAADITKLTTAYNMASDPSSADPQTGMRKMSLSKPELAAYFALAHMDGYASQSMQFEAEIGKFLLGKEKVDADAMYKKSMGAAAGIKARAYARNMASQIKLRESKGEQDAFYKDLFKTNFISQPLVTIEKFGADYSLIPNEKSIPLYIPSKGGVTILQPFNSTPVYANGTNVPDDAKQKPVYYKGGHFGIEYQSPQGRYVDIKDVKKDYNEKTIRWNKSPDEVKLNNPMPSFDDFLKNKVEKNELKFKVMGANGTIDESLFRAGQMQLSNMSSTGKEENIFQSDTPPADDQLQFVPEQESK